MSESGEFLSELKLALKKIKKNCDVPNLGSNTASCDLTDNNNSSIELNQGNNQDYDSNVDEIVKVGDLNDGVICIDKCDIIEPVEPRNIVSNVNVSGLNNILRNKLKLLHEDIEKKSNVPITKEYYSKPLGKDVLDPLKAECRDNSVNKEYGLKHSHYYRLVKHEDPEFLTSTPDVSVSESAATSHNTSAETQMNDINAGVTMDRNNSHQNFEPASKNSKPDVGKGLHAVLYNELHCVLKKRTQVAPKVNVDDIGRHKCGKSIVFFGRSPTQRKNSDSSSSLNSSLNGAVLSSPDIRNVNRKVDNFGPYKLQLKRDFIADDIHVPDMTLNSPPHSPVSTSIKDIIRQTNLIKNNSTSQDISDEKLVENNCIVRNQMGIFEKESSEIDVDQMTQEVRDINRLTTEVTEGVHQGQICNKVKENIQRLELWKRMDVKEQLDTNLDCLNNRTKNNSLDSRTRNLKQGIKNGNQQTKDIEAEKNNSYNYCLNSNKPIEHQISVITDAKPLNDLRDDESPHIGSTTTIKEYRYKKNTMHIAPKRLDVHKTRHRNSFEEANGVTEVKLHRGEIVYPVEMKPITPESSPDSSKSDIEFDNAEHVSEIRKVFEKDSSQKGMDNNEEKLLMSSQLEEIKDEESNIFKPTCLRIVCKPLDEEKLASVMKVGNDASKSDKTGGDKWDSRKMEFLGINKSCIKQQENLTKEISSLFKKEHFQVDSTDENCNSDVKKVLIRNRTEKEPENDLFDCKKHNVNMECCKTEYKQELSSVRGNRKCLCDLSHISPIPKAKSTDALRYLNLPPPPPPLPSSLSKNSLGNALKEQKQISTNGKAIDKMFHDIPKLLQKSASEGSIHLCFKEEGYSKERYNLEGRPDAYLSDKMDLDCVIPKSETSHDSGCLTVTPSSVSPASQDQISNHGNKEVSGVSKDDDDSFEAADPHPGSLISQLVETMREQVAKKPVTETYFNKAYESDNDRKSSDLNSSFSDGLESQEQKLLLKKQRNSSKLTRGKTVNKKRNVPINEVNPNKEGKGLRYLNNETTMTTVSYNEKPENYKEKMDIRRSPRPNRIVGTSIRKSFDEKLVGNRLRRYEPDVGTDLKSKICCKDFYCTTCDHVKDSSSSHVNRSFDCSNSGNLSLDCSHETSMYATFPLQRSFRSMERGMQEREMITRLMITHSGDRIPPDGAESDLHRANPPHQKRLVTVPQPTSFHQHGNDIGHHLIGGLETDQTEQSSSSLDVLDDDDKEQEKYRLSVVMARRSQNAKHLCQRYKAQYEGVNDKERSSRRYLRHQKSLDREGQKHLMYHTWSSNAAKKLNRNSSRKKNTTKHKEANLKHFYESPILVDDLGDFSTESEWKNVVNDEPMLDKVKKAKYKPQECSKDMNKHVHGCTPVLTTGCTCTPYTLAKCSADNVSVQSVCTYVWDRNNHHHHHKNQPKCNHHQQPIHHVDSNDSSFTNDFGDEFCDAYEKSLLDYVRTKDISDIDQEILTMHQKVVDNQSCLHGPGLMRRLAKCFICDAGGAPSQSVSRNTSHNDSCPITQTIVDSGSGIVVSGEGLYKAAQNSVSEFRVDARNHSGDLYCQVEGPNSIVRCQVLPEGMGRYLVRYTPLECGRFTITLKWNGRELPGSPYHPEVVNPAGVRVIGGWSSVLDSNNMMILQIGQTKRIEFDCSGAGPGQLSAEVRGPAGTVPTFIDNQGGGRWLMTFTPTVEGDHYVHIFWAGLHIQNSPFHGVTRSMKQINHEKVVLTGRGLMEAKVREEAEFVIDGTEAGPGQPEVTLTGVKADIDVRCTPLGSNKYRCSYVPKLPGAYLLNIMWSDRQVRGSPFKVSVTASSDASKVMVTSEGLKMGIMGRDIKTTIDTRKAGPGELTAQCMGPNKAAVCELFDHHDGTFTLSVKPAEAGRHVLNIQFGGEHVPGSPFVLKIAGAPDASKVRVSGPGIEHGILARYQSKFLCETKGAGAGQLTVRIRGPKGAFRVEMQRQSQKDRTIVCRYEPREVGDYIVAVKWSGEHVPGSPFRVQIFDTQSELERFLRDNPDRRVNAPQVVNGWEDEF